MKRRITLQFLCSALAFNFVASPNAAEIIVEAEDYNFNSGAFIDNPPPTGLRGSDGFPVNFGQGYYEKSGTQGIDYSDTQEFLGSPNDHYYRPNDLMGTRISNDTLRSKYETNGLQEIEVFLLQSSEWLNYTRTFPDAEYGVTLRAASGASQTVRVDLVTGDRSAPNQSTFSLGEFRLTNTGGAFQDFPLVSRQSGQPIPLALNGIQTLRLTATGANDNLQMNYFTLSPAGGGAPGPLVIAESGANVTVSWEGAGTLQSTSSLDGEWAPAGQSSPATFTPAAGESMFFRLVL